VRENEGLIAVECVGDFADKFLIGKRYEVRLEIEEQKEE
jgi:hypothetical protein